MGIGVSYRLVPTKLVIGGWCLQILQHGGLVSPIGWCLQRFIIKKFSYVPCVPYVRWFDGLFHMLIK